jgi:hypothetical protein
MTEKPNKPFQHDAEDGAAEGQRWVSDIKMAQTDWFDRVEKKEPTAPCETCG